jgi:hypothetical protein
MLGFSYRAFDFLDLKFDFLMLGLFPELFVCEI